MVTQKIKDIDLKKLKSAKGVMAVLELLGIAEEDLLLLKDIPAMKTELEELREFKAKTERTLETKATSTGTKSVAKTISDVYGKTSKEFNPHYGG